MMNIEEIAEILQKRRELLKLSQKDMRLKIGMSQQQYQRIESGADTRLSTFLRVLEGLELELLLAPKEASKKMNQKQELFEISEHEKKGAKTLLELLDELGDDL